VRLSEWLERFVDERSAFFVASALVVVVAAGDYLTGADVTFTLLYLLPVTVAAWYRGRAMGLAFAVMATACAGAIQVVQSVHERLPALIMTWNLVGSFGILVLVAAVMARLRDLVDRERDERRRAVSHLRHSERLNALGVFAAGVAHELGTPLAIISGTAELIEGEAARTPVRDLARDIQRQTKRMESIVRQVLDFGRPSAARHGDVELGVVCREVRELLAPLARRSRCDLELSLPPGPLVTRGDVRELGQVLTNLVMNALQASPAGATVTIGLRERGADAELFVADRGHGIAEEHVAHVFDPFFTTKDVDQGTGLGLSVSYGIIRDHGGRIDLTTGASGTTFFVRLPLATRQTHFIHEMQPFRA
jgi:signal transduction histidine kinase